MTEKAMKELFDRLVDGGAPPGVRMPVADVLNRNGLVLRRRRVRRAMAGGLALVAAAGLVAVLPNLTGDRAGPVSPAGPSSSTGPPSPADEEAVNRERAQLLLSKLEASVPAGYTVAKGDTTKGTDGSTYAVRFTFWKDSRRKPGRILSEAALEVQYDGRAAMLTAEVGSLEPGTPDPARPCDTKFAEEEQGCAVVQTRSGDPVRVGWWTTAAGPTRQAVRLYEDTYVLVEQASRPRPGVYGLGRRVLSDSQLAEFAAAPELAP